MHFSAANCVCGNRDRVIAPAMTRCCWRRRRWPVRAIAWLISAPASAPPALRSPNAWPASSLFWSRSIRELAGLARGNAASNAIAADVVVLDVTSAADAFAAAGLFPDSVDVVLMNPPFNDPAGTAPRRTRRARSRMSRRRRRWRAGFTRPPNPEIRRCPHPDLARRWSRGGAGGARSRLWQPRHPAGSRRAATPAIRCWSARSRAARRRHACMPR